MSRSLGRLTVDLVARVGGFVSGMDEAERASDKWRKKVEKNVKVVSTAIGVAVGASVTALTALTVQTVRSADEIAKLSAVAGSTAQEFQKYSAGARLLGVEQQKLADIFKDTSDKVGDFLETGGGAMADFFENIAPRVGVTAEQFRALSGPQALGLYVSSLEQAGVAQNEMTFYMEAIASDATMLLPLLRNNAEGFRLLGEEAEAAGTIMSDDTLAAAQELAVASHLLRERVSGIRNAIAAELLPTLAEMAGAFVDSNGEMVEGIAIAATLESVIKGVAVAAVGTVAAVDLLGRSIGGLAALGSAANDGARWYDFLFPAPAFIARVLKNWDDVSTTAGVVAGDLEGRAQQYAQVLETIWNAGGDSASENAIKRLAAMLTESRKLMSQSGSAADQASDSIRKYSERVKEAQDELEKMFAAEIKASDARQQTMDDARRHVEVLGRQVAVIGQGRAAQEALNRSLFIENELRKESYEDLLPHQREEYMRLIEQQYDLQRELERQTEQHQIMEANAVRGYERMRDAVGDYLQDMLVDGKASFSDFADMFKRMIAEMIATAAANRIMVGLAFTGGSAAAAAGGLGSGSGAGGLSNLFSVAQMANTAKTIWSGVQGIAAGEGLSGFSGLGGQLTSGITLWADKVGMNLNQGLSSLGQGMGQLAWGLESTGYTIAEAVGIQGISAGNATLIGSAASAGAGWAGGYVGAGLGRDLFGKEGSGWGATGGAMLGAYVGSIIPGLGTVLGSALGGLIGGVVDSIFGSSAWNTTRGGLQLGFDEGGEFDPMHWTRQTRKGGLFSSTRRRYQFHELDEELDAALSETYSAALDGVREMYGVLGVAVEDGLLEGIQIDTLQIGTSGKSQQSQEAIEQQIAQWFADLQEAAVQAIDPSLTSETLTVYAASLASVNEIFDAIGLSAYEVSVQGGKTSAQLLALAGGIENLLTATDFYYQNFYSEQERLANLTGQTTAALEAMGLALPDSRQGFRDIIEGLDRTTEAGQAMFLQLLSLAPAMHDIATAAEEAEQAAAAHAAETANRIMQERLGLEVEYLNLIGNTNSLRKRELAALDESNRSLQQHIWALEKQKEVAAQAASASSSITSTISGLRERITLDQMESDEDRYGYFKGQADSLMASIVGMTNIGAIETATRDSLRLAERAWGLLDEDQRSEMAPEYHGYLSRVNTLSEKQIEEASRHQANATAKAAAEAIATEFRPVVSEIVRVIASSGENSKVVAESVANTVASYLSNAMPGHPAYEEVNG